MIDNTRKYGRDVYGIESIEVTKTSVVAHYRDIDGWRSRDGHPLPLNSKGARALLAKFGLAPIDPTPRIHPALELSLFAAMVQHGPLMVAFEDLPEDQKPKRLLEKAVVSTSQQNNGRLKKIGQEARQGIILGILDELVV
jgi:hypothetical protein